jgi:spoIIIJ-associated protein
VKPKKTNNINLVGENIVKKEIITEGKTIEDALLLAKEQLGAPSVEDLDYTVIEEPKKGFLGIGTTPAKISVSYTRVGCKKALEFLNTLVADIGIEASVTLDQLDGGESRINIDGDGAGVLIGHHGDTLDSIQYLANLAANRKRNDEKRDFEKVTVDVEGYRAKREETLRALARKMANKVVKYKKSVMLEPMNPYERRIIHSEVQLIEGVATNSIGSENNRKVVIYLDPNASKKA